MLDVTLDGSDEEASVVVITTRVSDGTLVLTFTGKHVEKVLIDHTGTEACRDVTSWDEVAEDLWFAD